MVDAFLKTKGGRAVVLQAKYEIRAEEGKEIAARIRQLKELVWNTFVGQVPKGHGRDHALYQMAKGRIRELGAKGGPEYEAVLTAVKFAWNSPQECRDAIALFK
jgi:hypothetical protein